MTPNNRRSRRGPLPAGDSGSETQANTPPTSPPVQGSSPSWAEHIESVNMSQPQNMVNAPVSGGTVVNVTVNRSDGETSIPGGDLIHHHSTKLDPTELDDFATIARADHEIYCDQLLTKKRGFPLWVPGPGMQLPIEYRRQGISVGDVGIITSTGEFDFLFNIFQPADHAINGGLVPPGFSPLPRQGLERDIQRTTVYGPDTYLASSSVRKTSMNWISESSVDHRFESTAKEAAILIMPDGATTQNLLNTLALRSSITNNAREWYRFVRDTRGRDVRNGDIRVVVGIDKLSSWGIATSACNTGQTASYVFKHDSTQTYKWDCIGASGRVGPQRSEVRDLIEDNTVPQNQCVFVRTMNFTLSGRIRHDFPSEAIQKPASASGKRPRDLGSNNKGGSRGRGSSGSGNTSPDNQRSSTQGALDSSSQLVEFDPTEFAVSNHPSAALHDYLHEKFPDADMIITEDMDWIVVLNDDDTVFPESEDLCERVLKAHEPLNRGGVIQLLRNDGTGLQPTRSGSMVLGETEDMVVRDSSATLPEKRSTIGNISQTNGTPLPIDAESFMDLFDQPINNDALISGGLSGYDAIFNATGMQQPSPLSYLGSPALFATPPRLTFSSPASNKTSPHLAPVDSEAGNEVQECKYSYQEQMFHEALKLPMDGAGPFIPQQMYKPRSTSDRDRTDVLLEVPIFFYSNDPAQCGILMKDALYSRSRKLYDQDKPVLEGRGSSVSVRLNWPGYKPWGTQVLPLSFPGSMTLAKLARTIAKCVQRFIEEHKSSLMENESDQRWRVGEGPKDIKFEDLVLVSMHHVSLGSWQPQLRLVRPREPVFSHCTNKATSSNTEALPPPHHSASDPLVSVPLHSESLFLPDSDLRIQGPEASPDQPVLASLFSGRDMDDIFVSPSGGLELSVRKKVEGLKKCHTEPAGRRSFLT